MLLTGLDVGRGVGPVEVSVKRRAAADRDDTNESGEVERAFAVQEGDHCGPARTLGRPNRRDDGRNRRRYDGRVTFVP